MTNQPKTGFRRWLKGRVLKYGRHMITCNQFEDFVLSYLDDELSASQKSVFELHIRFCRECREYLAAYNRSVALGRAATTSVEKSLPEDVPEDLVKAIIEARNH